MDPDLQCHDAGDDVVGACQDRVAAEQQLTRALAAFQVRVAAISRLDLAAVSEAARPLFRQGVGWSAQLLSEQGRRKLPITVMHTAGAELRSEEWADEVDDLLQAAGWMLAMLLGIPVASSSIVRAPEPEKVAVLDNGVKASADSADSALSDGSGRESLEQQRFRSGALHCPGPPQLQPQRSADPPVELRRGEHRAGAGLMERSPSTGLPRVWLTTAQTCEMLGMTRETLRQLRLRGVAPAGQALPTLGLHPGQGTAPVAQRNHRSHTHRLEPTQSAVLTRAAGGSYTAFCCSRCLAALARGRVLPREATFS